MSASRSRARFRIPVTPSLKLFLIIYLTSIEHNLLTPLGKPFFQALTSTSPTQAGGGRRNPRLRRPHPRPRLAQRGGEDDCDIMNIDALLADEMDAATLMGGGGDGQQGGKAKGKAKGGKAKGKAKA